MPTNRVTIHCGDVLKWAAEYDGPPFHALLCDPPYHLTSITERFGKDGAAPAKDRDGVYRRAGAGFMGQQWDGGDIAFRPETWAVLARHLYPGAFVMAFAGTRGYHRMACAMEDAGLILHPMIVYMFGSGFPKATRIDTQIDKAAGAEREVIGMAKGTGKQSNRTMNGINTGRSQDFLRPEYPATLPVTDLARAWTGHRYGLQALKPALECIAVAQVPYRGRPVDCITKTGAGSLNVDGARVSVSMADRQSASKSTKGPTQHINNHAKHDYEPVEYHTEGRWPSNLILDDSPEVAAMFPQTQPSKTSMRGLMHSGRHGGLAIEGDNIKEGTDSLRGHEDDGGSSARFFYQSDWSYEVFEAIEGADPGVYMAKAGRRERDAGLERQPVKAAWNGTGSNGGLSVSAAHLPIRNNHPTVKTLRLTRYLATLLLPPAAYAPRRLLQPFSGSGSEAIGAALAGWEEVAGLEQSSEYCELARARAAWWQGHVGLFEAMTAEGEEAESQLCLL